MNGMNRSFPLDLLSEGRQQTYLVDDVADNMKQLIINAFTKIGVDINAVSFVVSPTIVRFEFITQKAMKLKRIRSCKDKLNEALSNYGPVRLIAPVPGKRTIAVEVPRPDRQIVRLREVLESKEFQESEAHLPVALGIDSENNTIVADLAKMPHLLIAGATGQGKSMLINSVILSLLYRLSPADLRLVLIDTKMGEFRPYDKLKAQYLLGYANESPEVVTSSEKVPSILNAIACEVEVRYRLFIKAECRNIREYNKWITDGKLSIDEYHHLPYIVVVIDEFADLKMSLEKDFEAPLARITAKARAVGIHLVIATQHPSTDIISGVIKANFPTRIAFKVGSEIDSKTILDTNGAGVLLGMGDMLFNDNGSITQIQSCFVDTEEIESICSFIANEYPNDTSFVLPIISDPDTFYKPEEEERDPLFWKAALLIVATDNDNEKKKSHISFNHLLDLLKSDDEDENDDDYYSKDSVMKENNHNGVVSFAELMDLINDEDSTRESKIPYEDYIIIGDTAEIDKMYRINGHINLDLADFLSTLSKDTPNYVSTGSAKGQNCVANALADALLKLPIGIDAISKLLFNVWIPMPKDMQVQMKEMKSMADLISMLPTDIDLCWGIASDESMEGQLAKVSLIAASK